MPHAEAVLRNTAGADVGRIYVTIESTNGVKVWIWNETQFGAPGDM